MYIHILLSHDTKHDVVPPGAYPGFLNGGGVWSPLFMASAVAQANFGGLGLTRIQQMRYTFCIEACDEFDVI
jgi:hypothetical protein